MSISMRAFTLRDKQNFLAMLNLLESAEVPDIPTARKLIEESNVAERFQLRKERSVERKERKTVGPRERKKSECPDCGKPTWRKGKIDGLKVMWCSSCKFSERI